MLELWQRVQSPPQPHTQTRRIPRRGQRPRPRPLPLLPRVRAHTRRRILCAIVTHSHGRWNADWQGLQPSSYSARARARMSARRQACVSARAQACVQEEARGFGKHALMARSEACKCTHAPAADAKRNEAYPRYRAHLETPPTHTSPHCYMQRARRIVHGWIRLLVREFGGAALRSAQLELQRCDSF